MNNPTITIVITTFLFLTVSIHLTHGVCDFSSDMSKVFDIPFNTPVTQYALILPTSNQIASVNASYDPINTKYFDFSFESYDVRLRPKDTLIDYYENESSGNLTILQLQLTCKYDSFVLPQLKIWISRPIIPPRFEPATVTYDLELPYGGAPINWQQYVKVTGDSWDPNDHITFYTKPDHHEMIVITKNPPERVPPDTNLPLEYYKLYFSLNDSWTETGSHVANIFAQNLNGETNLTVTLNIDKKCKVLTSSLNFVVPENFPVGDLAITLSVEHVKSIDPSGGNPMNEKYFSFELDVDAQKIYMRPKNTLTSFFDNEQTDWLSILQLKLTCTGTFHIIPEIRVKISDVNNHPPTFDPPLGSTYHVSLPYNGDLINEGQFIKVSDGDFDNIHTRVTFNLSRDDLIQLSPLTPERVPADSGQRLEYYKLYFVLRDEWTIPGNYSVVIAADNSDGIGSTFNVQLIVTECNFKSDLSQEFIIREDSGAGQVVLSLDVAGALGVDSSFDPGNDKYFSYHLDVPTQKLHLMATNELENYFDSQLDDHYSILQLQLNCYQTTHTAPTLKIHVIDANNRAPQFDPPSASYDVKLPYFGAPINWEQFVAVYDGDFSDANTKLNFTMDRTDLILFTPTFPERVPADPRQRLEYYKVYFNLNDEWTGVGIESVQITATDGGERNFADFKLVLNIS